MIWALHAFLSIAVFLAGAAAFGYALRGLLGRHPYRKRMWDLASAFTVTLYVQLLTGLMLVFAHRFFSGPLGLHMVLSMVAAALAQMTYSVNRRRPREERSYAVHVGGVGVALALVLAGILVLRVSALG